MLLAHAFKKKFEQNSWFFIDLADSGATCANRQTDREIILGI